MLASLFVPLSVQGTDLNSLSQLVRAHFTWGADAAAAQLPISGRDAENTEGTTG